MFWAPRYRWASRTPSPDRRGGHRGSRASVRARGPRRDGGPDHGRAAAAVAPPDALVRVWGRRPARLLRRLGPRDPRLPADLRARGRLAPARVRVHPAQGAHLLRAEERLGTWCARAREARVGCFVFARVTARAARSHSRRRRAFGIASVGDYPPPRSYSRARSLPLPQKTARAPRRTAPRTSLGPTARGATPERVRRQPPQRLERADHDHRALANLEDGARAAWLHVLTFWGIVLYATWLLRRHTRAFALLRQL